MARRSFVKLLVASDGHDVLFMVDHVPGTIPPRIQACTLRSDGLLAVHIINFDGPTENALEMAYQMLDTMGEEQTQIMRDIAASQVQKQVMQ